MLLEVCEPTFGHGLFSFGPIGLKENLLRLKREVTSNIPIAIRTKLVPLNTLRRFKSSAERRHVDCPTDGGSELLRNVGDYEDINQHGVISQKK